MEFFTQGEFQGDIMTALPVETHRIRRTRPYVPATVFIANPAGPETPKQVISLSFLDLHQLRGAKCNSFVPSISDLKSGRIKRRGNAALKKRLSDIVSDTNKKSSFRRCIRARKKPNDIY
jgi:hypothetical protein